MNDKEIGEEVLALARYGELGDLKNFLDECKSEFNDDKVRGFLEYLDENGSNGIFISVF